MDFFSLGQFYKFVYNRSLYQIPNFWFTCINGRVNKEGTFLSYFFNSAEAKEYGLKKEQWLQVLYDSSPK